MMERPRLGDYWHDWPRPARTGVALDPAPAGRLALTEALYAARGFRLRDYQGTSLLDPHPRKLHQDGRDVGKTTEIELCLLHFALTHAGRECLLAAQWQHNLAPTAERLIALCRNHPLLSSRVRRIVRSPFIRVEFDNDALILAKIAGHRGVNFQNTHVDFIAVDEAQNMLDVCWDELFPALNAGGLLYVYGVPNGLRNRFYQLSQDAGFAQYRWPSRCNPDFDGAKDAELARLYGGRSAPGYIHNVLGEHGSPAGSVFTLADLEACLSPSLEPFLELAPETPEADGALARWCTALEPGDARVLLGMDVGYSQDPSVLVAWAVEGEDERDWRLRALGVLRMLHVPYRAQAEWVQRVLDAAGAEWLSCDRGGGGLPLLQGLLERDPAGAERIARGADGELGVPFGGNLPGGGTRLPVKRATTDLYQRLLQERRVRFGDGPRMAELASHTYTLSPRGEVIYSKGHDHIIDADRALLYALLAARGGSVYSLPAHLDEI